MEHIMEQTQVAKTILFDNYNTLTRDAINALPPQIETNQNSVPEIFRNYEYPVSSWPVLIDREMSRKLEKLSTRIPELINTIPELYFNNDAKKIADYYFDGNEMLTQFALICHNKKVKVGCRLDLTFTNKGFKILEANIGSSIGGFQVQSFEAIIKKLHPALSDKFESRNIQLKYVRFLIDQILENVSGIKDEINVFISLSHLDAPSVKEKSVRFFNELVQYELGKRGLKGEVISERMDTLKLLNGALYCNEKEIHSVLVLNLNETDIPPAMFRAFIMNKIYLPDHLGIAIYGDKRNLSLLRELAEEGKFDSEDNALILDSIPWTSFVADKKALFQQKEYHLPNLLRQNKNGFVIKASNGYQGKDVFVGKFLTDEEWEEAIELAISTKCFIAQEFCDSIDFLAPDQTNTWTPHKLIWGSFGFGDTYGGVWVRMSAIKTDIGVINSATGAVEAIVYENHSTY